MTATVLTAAQARERHRHATGEVAHCLCRLDCPCVCGLEADLLWDDYVAESDAGWIVT